MWGWTSLERLAQDLRYGLRMLRRSPGFTAAAVLSLALGIGANTAIFSLIDAVLLKMLPVKDPEQLYVLQPAGRQGAGAFSYPGFEVLREQNQVFSETFTFSSEGDRWNVVVNGQSELTTGQLVTGNFFSALGVNTIAGRAITPADDRPSAAAIAVISHSYWKNKFGLDATTLGTTITINGVPVTIAGVAPPGFFGVSVGSAPEIWVPMAMQPQLSQDKSLLSANSTWWLFAMARLKPGVNEQQARANLQVVLPLVHGKMGITDKSGPLERNHFERIELWPGGAGISALRQEFSRPLRILMIVVGLVLLIACSNVANLLLSRATARKREIAIRLAVGGGRARLIRQLLTESVLLATLGGALGLLFAAWSGNLLIAFLASGRIPAALTLHLSARMLAFTGAISVLTGILFGVAPAFRATRVDAGVALKENARSSSGARLGAGRLLIIAQVAVSLLLLTGAGLFVRTLQNLRGRDLGFDPENVLLATIEPALAGYKDARLTSLYQQVLERINAIPGVRSASLSRFGLIGAGFSGRRPSVPGYTPRSGRENDAFNDAFNVVSPKFFETTGIALLAGREFGPGDTAAAPRVAVVNDKFARFYFGADNPIGKRLVFPPRSDEPIEIVGVVRDAKYFLLRHESPRTVFVPFLQYGSGEGLGRMIVEVRTAASPASMAAAVRREIQSVAKSVPVYNVQTQERQVDAALAQERLLATLTGFFSLLAVLLTCVGLYGIMAYAVTRRTSEIGVRMALGAGYGDVLWLILRQSVLLVGIGVLIGIPATLGATRLVSTMLFGLAANDPATIAASALLLAAVAAFAGWLPARRAARIDPMVALRYE